MDEIKQENDVLINSELTVQEIMELEAKPKTKKDIALDYLITFLPVLFGIISLLEYYYVPNYRNNKNTHVYGIFIGILTLGFFLYFIIGLLNKNEHSKLRYRAPFYSLIFILLTIYDFLTLKTNTLIMPYFPWLDHIFNAALEDLSYLIESFLSSIKLLFTGYLIGAILGLISGIFSGYSKSVRYWLEPFMTVIGVIPTVTWLPIVMVLAASLNKGAIFIIALGVWFSVTLSTMGGIRNIDTAYYDAAKTLGSNGNELIYKVAIPSALPNIFIGLIQGMSSACTSLILAEMMGVESGLGYYITWQKNWAQYSNMYAAILIICILFLVVNLGIRKLRDKILVWQEGRD